MPFRARFWLYLIGASCLCHPVAAQGTDSQEPSPPVSAPELTTSPTPAQFPVASTPVVSGAPPALEQTQEPSLEGPLALEQAITIALSRHGDVLSAREQFQAAQERITSAKSNRAPQLAATVGTDYQNGRTLVNVPGSSAVSTPILTSTLTTGITLSQNIFDSGRIKYNVRQSRGQAGNALSNIGVTKNSLAYEVAIRFFDQVRAERLTEQRLKQVETAKAQLDRTEAQITAGTSARSDIFDARVTYSQAQLDLVTAQSQLRVAVANFRGALGLGSGEKISLRDDTGAANTPSAETSTLELETALALSRRPDIVAARTAIFSNQAAIGSAKIDARPNVTASLGYNLDPRQTDNRRFNLGATLFLPLFNGRGRRADVRAAKDELEAAELRLAQVQRDAQIEVEAAWTQIAGQEERVKNAQAVVDAAQNALDVAQGRYGEGVGISLDVSVAQIRLFEAQVTLIGTQFDLRLARLDLRRATGDFAWDDGRVPETLQVIAAQR